MAEKRKAKRKRKRLRVTYSACDLEFTGYTSNLSSTGMFIKTSKPCRPGVPVRISIHVDKYYTICPFVKGRIIDLSRAAFKKIGNLNSCILDVKIEVMR